MTSNNSPWPFNAVTDPEDTEGLFVFKQNISGGGRETLCNINVLPTITDKYMNQCH